MAWIVNDCEECLGNGFYYWYPGTSEEKTSPCTACDGEGKTYEPDALEIIFQWLDLQIEDLIS